MIAWALMGLYLLFLLSLFVGLTAFKLAWIVGTRARVLPEFDESGERGARLPLAGWAWRVVGRWRTK